MVVRDAPLLAIKAVHKGEAGVDLLLWLMQLEAVVARISGLIAAQQDLTAGHLPRGMALEKGGEVIGDRFGAGSVGCRERWE